MFSKFHLKITIEFNLTKTDFLDVELDLINDSYAPFRKPHFQATYVRVKSKNPRYVVNQIPKSINKRLTTISKDEYSFKRGNENYQETLIKGGHKHSLYLTLKRAMVIKEKISCTSSHLFLTMVEAKIGKRFFKIISRNFESTYPYHKIFNMILLSCRTRACPIWRGK